MNEPAVIRRILEQSKVVAVVGLSDKPGRASLPIARYLKQQGYRIVPINPAATEILGETAYPSLEAASAAVGKIDLVNVFRAPEFIPEIVREAVRLKIPALWVQEGIRHEEAARLAEEAGLQVVMDRCIFQDHASLMPPGSHRGQESGA